MIQIKSYLNSAMKSFHEIQDIPVKFEATRSNVMIMNLQEILSRASPFMYYQHHVMEFSFYEFWFMNFEWVLWTQISNSISYEQVNEKEWKA